MSKQFYRSTGFTLIELLVTVSIVGLLAMVVYPGYQDSILKSRRMDGVAAVLAMQMTQEKFRANCPFYAQSLGNANVCGATAGASKVKAISASSEGYYTILIVASSASENSYTIAAKPVGIQMGDTTCDPMTITFNAAFPNGLKAPAECW